MSHEKDSDCTPDDSGFCTLCGVEHGPPCPDCGASAFHAAGCLLSDETWSRAEAAGDLPTLAACVQRIAPDAVCVGHDASGLVVNVHGLGAESAVMAVEVLRMVLIP